MSRYISLLTNCDNRTQRFETASIKISFIMVHFILHPHCFPNMHVRPLDL
jgi:hypothetical protein